MSRKLMDHYLFLHYKKINCKLTFLNKLAMKSTLIAIFLAGLTITSTQAQNNESVIKDNDQKIQFTVPDGWQSTKKGDGYLMGSENTHGFMLIKVQNFKSIKKLRSAMEAGIEQEDGSILALDGELSNLGKQGVSGMYKGTIDGTEMQGFLMALMPPSKGRAAICITVAPVELFNQSNMDQLKILLRSVIFL